jgi:hypothetical protein
MTTRAWIEAIVDGLGLAAGREIFREANASIPDVELDAREPADDAEAATPEAAELR